MLFIREQAERQERERVEERKWQRDLHELNQKRDADNRDFLMKLVATLTAQRGGN